MTPKLHSGQEEIDMKILDCAYSIFIILVLPFSSLIYCCCSGQLGISAFRHIVSDSRTQNIPLILETPIFDATEIWMKEIYTLNHLSKLVDDTKVPQTESLLLNEITSLVRSRATNKQAKTSKTRTRKRDTEEG